MTTADGEVTDVVVTQRDSLRWQTMDVVLAACTSSAHESRLAVHGSFALALTSGASVRRVPQDLDLAAPDESVMRRVVSSWNRRVDGWQVQAEPGGAVPFRPGRDVAPAEWMKCVVSRDDEVVDVVLVDVSVAPRRWTWAIETGDTLVDVGGTTFSVSSRYTQLADKYQSLMRRRREGRINMRWQDLMDSAQMLRHPEGALRASETRRHLSEVLSWDSRSRMWSAPPPAPSEWAAAWRKHRAVASVPLPSIEEAQEVFAAFWAVPSREARWDPAAARWTDEPGAWARAT